MPSSSDAGSDGRLRLTVRLFAAAREVAGCEALAVELPAGADARALLAEVAVLRPALGPLVPFLRVAVDEAFVDDGAPLTPGADVALIPPVGGGSPRADCPSALRAARRRVT